MTDRRPGRFVAFGISVAVAVTAACATAPRAEPPDAAAWPTADLDAVLWVQTAEEYEAAALQAYAAAEAALERALADSSWTAALVQTGAYATLPPAVIVDVDETVLDNSPFDARMILEGGAFDPDAWAGWVDAAEAEPVPGALEFLREAARRGVTVFYVTNRDAPRQEEGTRRNLERAGFPLGSDRDVVLLRGEREEWTSDKSSRRAAVAGEFRVLLVIGDDLGDFLPALLPLEEREGLARRHADRWGERWILLPNPMYGSWESALWGNRSGLSPAEQLEAKREALDPGP